MNAFKLACASAVLLLAAPTAWAASDDIHVTGAWTRATPGASSNAAVYFTIVNSGTTADRLISVESSWAQKAELHETMAGNMNGMAGMGDMMEMKPSGPVEVAPGATVIFKPLGRHLMLMGLKRKLRVGDALSVTLNFEKAGAMTLPVEVVAPAARGP